MKLLLLGAAVAVVILLGGCDQRSGTTAADRSAWQGRWTGPEGTFLEIRKDQDRYSVTIQDLDGPSTFDGVAVADGIQFVRDGKRELLHATDGPGTGMKWLQDEENCLTVSPGEGFCRD
jgi:hypothetical protein